MSIFILFVNAGASFEGTFSLWVFLKLLNVKDFNKWRKSFLSSKYCFQRLMKVTESCFEDLESYPKWNQASQKSKRFQSSNKKMETNTPLYDVLVSIAVLHKSNNKQVCSVYSIWIYTYRIYKTYFLVVIFV